MRRQRSSGISLLELIIAVTVLSVLLVNIAVSIVASQGMVFQDRILTQVELRGQNAMERIVELLSQAVTTDAHFSPLRDKSGIASNAIRFRLIQSINAAGSAVYDDNLKVFIYGGKTNECTGLVALRGPDLSSIWTKTAGADQLFGTSDDDNNYAFEIGVPANELLVPDKFAPRTGEMFSLDFATPPVGRALTVTIRLNAVGKDGGYLLPNDHVIQQTVALRQ